MPANSTVLNLDLDSGDHSTSTHALVAIGGKPPYCYQVPTSKLLDVIVELAPGCRNLETNRKKQARKTLGQKLYNKTRPGFYSEISQRFIWGMSDSRRVMARSTSGISSAMTSCRRKSKA